MKKPVKKKTPRAPKKCRVTFLPRDAAAVVPRGASIYEASLKAGVQLNSACGGQKQCGKCKVRVRKGKVKKGAALLLDAEDARAGLVLACDTRVEGDIVVEVPPESIAGVGRILESAAARADAFPLDPLVRKIYVEPEPPSVENNIDDAQRLAMAVCKAGMKAAEPDLDVIRDVTGAAREKRWKLTATYAPLGETWRIIRVEAGNHEADNLAVAIDIGTTTVVVQLLEANTGRVIDTESKYNSQMKFGEDYIKRIMYAEEFLKFDEMRRLILGDVNELIAALCARNGADSLDICSVTTAGNAAMQHFFLGLDPRNIRREPFVPAANFMPPVRASEVGLDAHPRAVVRVLPGVSVYVGADITAGVLATGLYRNEELSLHIDIGTNGEIVLGSREWMACCSASAGPSFEGSGVKHGMRATDGAIEKIRIDGGTATVATIGDSPAAGICGSGLVDALAELFKAGLLDRSGRFHVEQPGPVRADEEGTPEFVLVPKAKSRTKRDIVINQIDIQDLLRSKAAIFAATAILVESMDVKFEDIRHVYIAGGFGNCLNIENAVIIGMLPDLPKERIEFVGNTALEGAKMCLMSREALAAVEEIARKMTYFDLMSNYKYMDYYQQALFLPHTDLGLFPSAKKYARK
jgi:uncharacterized 2Fe-2S/4Fe-4S cluster protein (DUF4445 family)